ncbi:MAG: hypothetical protein JST63_01375 [Bacteroidetes bacterium]|nr:hypothetical protein [Bacteroidota bacterium]
MHLATGTFSNVTSIVFSLIASNVVPFLSDIYHLFFVHRLLQYIVSTLKAYFIVLVAIAGTVDLLWFAYTCILMPLISSVLPPCILFCTEMVLLPSSNAAPIENISDWQISLKFYL